MLNTGATPISKKNELETLDAVNCGRIGGPSAFAFRQHFRQLLGDDAAGQATSLNYLNGFRVIACFVIISGHYCLFALGALQMHDAIDILAEPSLRDTLFFRITLMVDIFFVISGFLAFLNVSRSLSSFMREAASQVDLKSPRFKVVRVAVRTAWRVAKLALQRFIRLVIPVIFLYLFATTVASSRWVRHVAVWAPRILRADSSAAKSKIFIDAAYQRLLHPCVDDPRIALRTILLLQNFDHLKGPQCLIWTWYLAVDWQLYLTVIIPIAALVAAAPYMLTRWQQRRGSRCEHQQIEGGAKPGTSRRLHTLRIAVLVALAGLIFHRSVLNFFAASSMGLRDSLSEVMGTADGPVSDTTFSKLQQFRDLTSGVKPLSHAALAIRSVRKVALPAALKLHYVSPFVRAPPYFIGMLVGVYLSSSAIFLAATRRPASGRGQQASLRRDIAPSVVSASQLAAGVGAVFLLFSFFETHSALWSDRLGLFYVSLGHTVTGLIVASAILTFHVGRGRRLHRVFASRCMQTLSKLSFSLYLTHPIVEAVVVARYVNWMQPKLPLLPTVAVALVTLAACLATAVGFHVLIERPSTLLLRAYLGSPAPAPCGPLEPPNAPLAKNPAAAAAAAGAAATAQPNHRST